MAVSLKGQINILERIQLKSIKSFSIKNCTILHACLSDKYLVVAYKQQQQNFIEVFKINQGNQNVNIDQQYQLNFPKQIKQVIMNQNEEIIIISQIQNGSKDLKKREYLYELSQHSLKNGVTINKQQIELETKIICFQNNSKLGVFLTQNNQIILYSLEDLSYFSKINIKGEPLQSVQLTDQDELYFYPLSNKILKIKCQELKDNLLTYDFYAQQQEKNNSIFELKTIESEALTPSAILIKVIDNNIYSFFENEIIFQNLNDVSQKSKYCGINLSATCISVDQNADLLAVGDFLGNVKIYSCELDEISLDKNSPIYQVKLESGIRCLDWLPNSQQLAIGTFDGQIIISNVKNGESQIIHKVKESNCSITSLKFKKHSDQILLLATNTLGQVIILEQCQSDNLLKFKTEIQAHFPQISSNQFGTLDKYAEIWSSVWGVSKVNSIATSSEDTSIKIFQIINGQINLQQTISNHSLAVTSIDWKIMNNQLKEIFASCSDDQTIVIYDPRNYFKILCIFSTSFIKEWHTLTYISLEEEGTRVAVGSQNGYLFVIDLLLNQFIYAERIHLGGIEGVIWKKNKIFTCSNDCSVNVVNLEI